MLLDSLCAAFLCLLVVAGVRKSWSFSAGSVLGGGDPSPCLIYSQYISLIIFYIKMFYNVFSVYM